MNAYIKPEHFDQVFYTHITFYGSEKKVICAFDEPDDVHVWLYDNDYNITYDTTREDRNRIESFAHEIMEQVWSTLNTPFTLNSHHLKNRYTSASCVFFTRLQASQFLF